MLTKICILLKYLMLNNSDVTEISAPDKHTVEPQHLLVDLILFIDKILVKLNIGRPFASSTHPLS